jgi:flagellin-like protein
MIAANSKKAVTPILATLLIIVITVAAIAVTYAWISSAVENTANQAGVSLYVANVAFSDHKITIDIGNSGTSNTQILSLYVGTSQSNLQRQTLTGDTSLAVGQIRSFELTYEWREGVQYQFKIGSTAGQQALVYYAKASDTSMSQATASGTSITNPTPTATSTESQQPTQTPTTSTEPTATSTETATPTPTATQTPESTPSHTPGAQVTIKFALTGAPTVNGGETVITIDGVSYAYSDLNWRSWTWQAWTTHSVG